MYTFATEIIFRLKVYLETISERTLLIIKSIFVVYITFGHFAGEVPGDGAVVIVPHPGEGSGRVDLNTLVSLLF